VKAQAHSEAGTERQTNNNNNNNKQTGRGKKNNRETRESSKAEPRAETKNSSYIQTNRQ